MASKPCILNMPAGSPLGSDVLTNKTIPGLHSASWLALSAFLFSPRSPLVSPLLSSTLPPIIILLPLQMLVFFFYPECLISSLPIHSNASPLDLSLQPIISSCPRLCPPPLCVAAFLITVIKKIAAKNKHINLYHYNSCDCGRFSLCLLALHGNNDGKSFLLRHFFTEASRPTALCTLTGSEVCVNIWTEQHLLNPCTAPC